VHADAVTVAGWRTACALWRRGRRATDYRHYDLAMLLLEEADRQRLPDDAVLLRSIGIAAHYAPTISPPPCDDDAALTLVTRH
jgi:hypothetical protein